MTIPRQDIQSDNNSWLSLIVSENLFYCFSPIKSGQAFDVHRLMWHLFLPTTKYCFVNLITTKSFVSECCPNSQMMTRVQAWTSPEQHVESRWRNVMTKSFLLTWRTFSWNGRYSLNNGWYLPRKCWIILTLSLSFIFSVLSYSSSAWWMSWNGIIYFTRSVSMWKGTIFQDYMFYVVTHNFLTSHVCHKLKNIHDSYLLESLLFMQT